jgi:hypothetical protein
VSFVEQAAEVLSARDAHVGHDSVADARALADADLLRPEWATPEAERIVRRFRELCDEVGIPHDPDVLIRHHRGNAGLAAAAEAYGKTIRPPWATPEAKAVLAALAKRAEASDALAAYHATTPEHVGMSLHWTRLAQDYSDADDAVNTAFDAYVASLDGGS